jgi:hypothetical protein
MGKVFEQEFLQRDFFQIELQKFSILTREGSSCKRAFAGFTASAKFSYNIQLAFIIII